MSNVAGSSVAPAAGKTCPAVFTDAGVPAPLVFELFELFLLAPADTAADGGTDAATVGALGAVLGVAILGVASSPTRGIGIGALRLAVVFRGASFLVLVSGPSRIPSTASPTKSNKAARDFLLLSFSTNPLSTRRDCRALADADDFP
jgi:hypothetical protein